MKMTIQSDTGISTNTDLMEGIPKGGNLLKHGEYTCIYLVKDGECCITVFKGAAYGLFRGLDIADVPDSVINAVKGMVDTNFKSSLSNNAKIKGTLADCAALISELSEDLTVAQVRCYPLTHFTNNSTYRASKARSQLIEKGLIRRVSKGYELTELGLELRIGTHSRSPTSGAQIIRYSDVVVKHFNMAIKKGGSVRRISGIRFKNSNGDTHIAESIPSFSKKHNLQRGKLYMMIKGVVISHRGWTLA